MKTKLTEKVCHDNTNEKEAVVAALISDRKASTARDVVREKGQCIMIKRLVL